MTRVRTRILMTVMVCLLCACGRQEAEGDAREQEHWAVAETQVFPGDVGNPKYLLCMQETLCYLSGDKPNYVLNTFSGDPPAVSRLATIKYPGEGAEDAYLSAVYPCGAEEKSFLVLWQQRIGESGKSFALIKYDMQGNVLDSVWIDTLGIREDLSEVTDILEADGRYYLLANRVLLSFTSQGQVKRTELENGDWRLLSSGEGPLLIEIAKEKTLIRPLSDGGPAEKGYEISLGSHQFCAGEGGTLYLSDGLGLYRCEMESGTVEPVLDWMETGLSAGSIRTILTVSEDRITVLGEQSGYKVWTLEPTDYVDERTVVTMLTLNGYHQWLTARVREFNETNEQYRIVIVNPMDVVGNYEEQERWIQLQLTSSQPPDLVDIYGVKYWAEYAGNGAFEDLTPYMEASDVLDASDYLPNVLACGQVDGRQVFLPYVFSLNGLVYGRERYLGSGQSWSLRELLDTCERWEDISPFYGTPLIGLNKLWRLSKEEFVDVSGGECDFRNPLFYDLLRCAGNCRDPNINGSISPLESLLTDQQLMYDQSIESMHNYLYGQGTVSEKYGASVAGEQMVIKGIASGDGQIRGYITPKTDTGAALAICSTGANKEGAWQFIEYLQDYEDEDSIYYLFTLPARKDRFLERVGDKEASDRIDSRDMKKREWSEEAVGELVDIIEHSGSWTHADDIILQIVTEEAQSYFDGQKTEEEVAEIIQNRVQLYLSE